MSVLCYVFKKWWKFLFTNPLCLIGIIHGIMMGVLIDDLNLTGRLLLFLIPFIAVVIGLIIKNRNRDSTQCCAQFQAYWCMAFLLQQYVDSIRERDITGIVVGSIVLFLIYFAVPFCYAFTLHAFYSYSQVRRYRRRDVQGDYEQIESEGVVENCPICLEGMEENIVKLNNCSHQYHESCIADWLIRKRNCPVCRERSRREMHPLNAAQDVV